MSKNEVKKKSITPSAAAGVAAVVPPPAAPAAASLSFASSIPALSSCDEIRLIASDGSSSCCSYSRAHNRGRMGQDQQNSTTATADDAAADDDTIVDAKIATGVQLVPSQSVTSRRRSWSTTRVPSKTMTTKDNDNDNDNDDNDDNTMGRNIIESNNSDDNKKKNEKSGQQLSAAAVAGATTIPTIATTSSENANHPTDDNDDRNSDTVIAQSLSGGINCKQQHNCNSKTKTDTNANATITAATTQKSPPPPPMTTLSSTATTMPTSFNRQRAGYIQPLPGAYQIPGPAAAIENGTFDIEHQPFEDTTTTATDSATMTTSIIAEQHQPDFMTPSIMEDLQTTSIRASASNNNDNDLVRSDNSDSDSDSTTTRPTTSVISSLTNNNNDNNNNNNRGGSNNNDDDNNHILISAEIVDEDEAERLRLELIAETEKRVRNDFVLAKIVEHDDDDTADDNDTIAASLLNRQRRQRRKRRRNILLLSIFVIVLLLILVSVSVTVTNQYKQQHHAGNNQTESCPRPYSAPLCDLDLEIGCIDQTNRDNGLDNPSCHNISMLYGCFEGTPKEMTYFYSGCACDEIYDGSTCTRSTESTAVTCRDTLDDTAAGIINSTEVLLEARDAQTGRNLTSGMVCAGTSIKLTSPDGISSLPESIHVTIREINDDDGVDRVLQNFTFETKACFDHSNTKHSIMLLTCPTTDNMTLPNEIDLLYTGCTCDQVFTANATNICRDPTKFYDSHSHILSWQSRQKTCTDFSYTLRTEADIPAITQQQNDTAVRYTVTTTKGAGIDDNDDDDNGDVLASGTVRPGDNFTISRLFSNRMKKEIPFPETLNISIYEINDDDTTPGRILQSVILPSLCTASHPILLQGVEVNSASLQLLQIVDSNNQIFNEDGRDAFITKHYGSTNGVRQYLFPITIKSNSQRNVTITSIVANSIKLYPGQALDYSYVDVPLSSSNLIQEENFGGDVHWSFDLPTSIDMYNTSLYASYISVFASDEDNNQCAAYELEMMYLP